MIELTKLYQILQLYFSEPSEPNKGDSKVNWLYYYRPPY